MAAGHSSHSWPDIAVPGALAFSADIPAISRCSVSYFCVKCHMFVAYEIFAALLTSQEASQRRMAPDLPIAVTKCATKRPRTAVAARVRRIADIQKPGPAVPGLIVIQGAG